MEFDREYRKIMEAISFGDVRKHKLFKKHSGAYDEVLDEVFGGKNRIMMPLNIDYSTIDNAHILFLKIDEFLDKHGYSVETLKDYIDGKAVKFKIDSDGKHIYDTKNPVKIGKLLQKFEEDGEIEVTERKDGKKTTKKVVGKPLLHEFKNDPIRASNGEFLIVISRHPYDVAGSSTDRSWTSCMDLGFNRINYPKNKKNEGVNRRFVSADIREGTLVAYVVTKNELFKGANGENKVKIQKPLSRILIKPNESKVGKLYSIGMMYGSSYPEFYQTVKEWISEKLNNKLEDSDQKVNSNRNLYYDGDTPVGFKFDDVGGIKALKKYASEISKISDTANVWIEREEGEFVFNINIDFTIDVSNCGVSNIEEFPEDVYEQIYDIFSGGDLDFELEMAVIHNQKLQISQRITNVEFDDPALGMEYLKMVPDYIKWIKQNVEPNLCKTFQELGLTNSVTESFQFDREYRELMLEFSEGAIRNIVKKFQNDATEQEIRREVADFEKYKNALQKKDPFQYKSWIEFTEAIHAAKGKAEFKKKKTPSQEITANQEDIIADDENVTIYKGDSQDKCVMYGAGYSFCISRKAGGNMFSNYRLSKDSTFYFIYFKKIPKNDPKHIMVLDHTKHGYEWTFANNNTQRIEGGWGEIVSNYPELKKYKNILTNKVLDEDEKQLITRIRAFNNDPNLDIFNKFSYKEKHMALKSVHELPDEIWKTLDASLRNEFLGIGANLTEYQINDLKPNEIRRYKKSRILSRQELIDSDRFMFNRYDEGISPDYVENKIKSNTHGTPFFVISYIKNISNYIDVPIKWYNYVADNMSPHVLVEYLYDMLDKNINIPLSLIDNISNSPTYSFNLAEFMYRRKKRIPLELFYGIASDDYISKKYANLVEWKDIPLAIKRTLRDFGYGEKIQESSTFDRLFEEVMEKKITYVVASNNFTC